MRVEKDKIIKGFTSYIESEVIPKISGDKAFQIILSIGINAVKANSKYTDIVLENQIFKALSDYSEGTYDIDLLLDEAEKTISKYGYFPVTIPPVPFISPSEKNLKFNADDVGELRKYIEGAI